MQGLELDPRFWFDPKLASAGVQWALGGIPASPLPPCRKRARPGLRLGFPELVLLYLMFSNAFLELEGLTEMWALG